MRVDSETLVVSCHAVESSWIEISQEALENNIKVFQTLAQDRFKVGFVLKGNAYGHGLAEVFSIIAPFADCVYVMTAQEALALKSQNYPAIRRVVMGPCNSSEMLACAKAGIEVVLGNFSWQSVLNSLRDQHLKLKIHLHIDTGLSREGFLIQDFEKLVLLNQSQDVLQIVGVMSHFANTEDVTEQDYALKQIQSFEDSIKSLKKLLVIPSNWEKHLSASAAMFVLPKAWMSRVRIGISLYGFWPSVATRLSAKWILKELPVLKPVLTWKCKSQHIKSIKKGTYIGYGCTYRCDRETKIAIFPVGYYDGYPRLASGKAYVLVEGQRCPVLGRVMMNHLVVDITDIEISSEQVQATLLGISGEEVISAEMLGDWSNTIHYEILARLGQHLRREIIKKE